MNAINRTLGKALTGAAVATTLLFGTLSAHAATPSCAVSSLDARLVAKADQGAAPLRRFVEISKPIYQLDLNSAMDRVNRTRHVEAQCAVTTASR